MQTTAKWLGKSVCLLIVLNTACCATLAFAQQPKPPIPANEQVVAVSGKRTDLEIIEKFSKILQLKTKITRVDGFDPAIVTVTALTEYRVRIQAIGQGVTTVILTDKNDSTYMVDIFVKGDSRLLQTIINRKFPNSSVDTFLVRDSVVLHGWVTKPENITQIVEIAETIYPNVLNQMSVGGVQQVKIKVKVMEVQRSKIRQMGFNFLFLNRTAAFTSTPGQLVQLGAATLPFGGPPAVTFNADSISGATSFLGVTGANSIFSSFIEALKEESLLKILAEPELVTTNGRPATMLAGGEFPILVPQSLGTTTIEWREFGVRMQFVPIILGNGRLRLEVMPEVSERDFTNAVDLAGVTVPGLTTRRVNTQVEMRFGQTLMITGLIATRKTAETDKIPFLGELPWIGAAFRRVRYDDVETDLVILVTPELVAPLEPGQVPQGGPGMFTATPTDRELYFGGIMEVPDYGDPCVGCGVPEMYDASQDLSIPGVRGSGASMRGRSDINIVPEPEPQSAQRDFALPPVPASDADQAKAGSRRSPLGRRFGIGRQPSNSSNSVRNVNYPGEGNRGNSRTNQRRRKKAPGLIAPNAAAGTATAPSRQRTSQLIQPTRN